MQQDYRLLRRGCLVAGVVAVCAGVAQAQPRTAEVVKTQLFTQVTDRPPTDPDSRGGFFFEALITGSDLPRFIGQASVQTPSSGELITLIPSEFIYFFIGLADTQAEFDARFPGGTYVFSITGGSLGDATADVDVPVEDQFAPIVPWVTNWDEIQANPDPSADLTLRFPAWTAPDSVNNPFTFVVIGDRAGLPVFDTAVDTHIEEITIAGGTLAPQTQYFAFLIYSAEISNFSDAFGGISVRADFSRVTRVSFSTGGGAPCPACVADFDGSGDAPDGADIEAFFAAWLEGEDRADADCSGGVIDGGDIDVFFGQWLAGGC